MLDVGCGAGDISMLIAELVGPTASVIGVDADPACWPLPGSGSVHSRPAGNADSPNVLHAATVVSLAPLIEKAGLATFAAWSRLP